MLFKKIDGEIIFDRFFIMLYMMKSLKSPNEMEFEDFPYKALVKKIYEDLRDDLNNFQEEKYQLLDITLNEFVYNNLETSLKK